MEDIGNGVYLVEGDADFERVREVMDRVADRERERLTAQHPEWAWWADVVFALHDLNNLSNLLVTQGQEVIAEGMAEIVTTTAQKLLLIFLGGDKERLSEVLQEIAHEGQVLDAVFSKEITEAKEQ